MSFYRIYMHCVYFYEVLGGDFMEDAKKLKTGTTTVGIKYKDGVLIAAEKKATMGYLVASKEALKVHHLIDSIGMTIAGSVGDAQALIRLIRAEMELYKYEHKYLTVKATATLVANVLRSSYKSFVPEFVQLIIGGYDIGPQLFSLDMVGGMDDVSEYTFSGSGSVMAVGVLEDRYRKDMKEDEAIELAVRSIRVAMERDAASGGKGIDVAIMDSKGFRYVDKNKINKIIEKVKVN